MPIDPGDLTAQRLQQLKACLDAVGYCTAALAERLGLNCPQVLLSNTARYSLAYSASLGTTADEVLSKLFVFCTPVPIGAYEMLPRPLPEILFECGLVTIERSSHQVLGLVSLTEVDGLYYLSDRLFENDHGRVSVTLPEVCMPPHASSFELMRAMQSVSSTSRLLDVGCGSACLSLPRARSASEVTGIDIDRRSVAFARANSLLNGTRAHFEAVSWEEYGADRPYDHIVFNAPANAAFGFVNTAVPRLLSSHGTAQVWTSCEITEDDGEIDRAVERMTTISSSFDLRVMINKNSLFSLSRNAITSGDLPRDTLVVRHPAEWQAYLDSLHSRRVIEVASIVIEVTHLDRAQTGQAT